MNTTTSNALTQIDADSSSDLQQARPSRRSFLVSTATSAVSASALSLGFHIPSFAKEGSPAGAAVEVNAWVVIHPDDRCVIRIARAEMGQGSSTGPIGGRGAGMRLEQSLS